MRLNFSIILATLLALSTNSGSAIADGSSIADGSAKADGSESDGNAILSLDQARQYMLFLINRDRAAHGLSPVILDIIASQAGQVHCDNMALNNYMAHYDTDGKKPWQRYNQLGGIGYVSENVFWWGAREYEGYEQDLPTEESGPDGRSVEKPFALHSVQVFKKSDIEEAESGYYNEVPPNDGHRKNILDPLHNGVGIAFSIASDGSRYRFANSQEFTDNYGQFSSLPRELSQPFYVTGTLAPGWAVQCVSILWEAAPQPMLPEVLAKIESYKHPNKTLENYFAVQWAKQKVETRTSNGRQQFRVLVTPQKNWKPGLYYVDVRAQYNGGKPELISRRTISISK